MSSQVYQEIYMCNVYPHSIRNALSQWPSCDSLWKVSQGHGESSQVKHSVALVWLQPGRYIVVNELKFNIVLYQCLPILAPFPAGHTQGPLCHYRLRPLESIHTSVLYSNSHSSFYIHIFHWNTTGFTFKTVSYHIIIRLPNSLNAAEML